MEGATIIIVSIDVTKAVHGLMQQKNHELIIFTMI